MIPSRPSPVVRAAVPAALVAALACACSPPSVRGPGDIDPKLSLTTYVEEGKLLALVVGTRPARYREERPYIPLEVAVVNKSLPSLTLTAESFTLVDEAGRRYSPVGRDELARGYGSIDLDRRLGELEGVVLGRYQAFQRIDGTLTPSFDQPIERTVRLPKYTFTVDFVYFPKPEGGVVGKRFDLFLDAPELTDPVFVRFEIED